MDDSNRADYVAHGSAPFRPFRDEPTYSMSYFQAPTEVLEDPDVLVEWARKAIAVARRSGATRKKSSAADASSAVKKKSRKGPQKKT